jgi:flagellar biosynthesis/type III secretory pathway protein FliH
VIPPTGFLIKEAVMDWREERAFERELEQAESYADKQAKRVNELGLLNQKLHAELSALQAQLAEAEAKAAEAIACAYREGFEAGMGDPKKLSYDERWILSRASKDYLALKQAGGRKEDHDGDS